MNQKTYANEKSFLEITLTKATAKNKDCEPVELFPRLLGVTSMLDWRQIFAGYIR